MRKVSPRKVKTNQKDGRHTRKESQDKPANPESITNRENPGNQGNQGNLDNLDNPIRNGSVPQSSDMITPYLTLSTIISPYLLELHIRLLRVGSIRSIQSPLQPPPIDQH
jgi:phospholipase C